MLSVAPDPVVQVTSVIQAAAAVATFLVAAVAAVVAYFQVREARRTREDQARPYVAAYLEMDGFIIDLVVKNFGTTVARNVTMTPDRPMHRTKSTDAEPDPIGLFDDLPVLVPGQEWRTWFDSGIDLANSQEAQVYTVVLNYSDARGRPLPPDEFRLDWRQFENILYRTEKGLPDIAETLGKIERHLNDWSESGSALGTSGLSIFTRDGARKDGVLRRYVRDLNSGVPHRVASENARRRWRGEPDDDGAKDGATEEPVPGE